jgi:hypothetical protein
MLNWLESDFFYRMFNNIYMLCHYGSNIVSEVNSSITYNDGSSLLLTGNLGMSYVEMKETIFHELRVEL